MNKTVKKSHLVNNSGTILFQNKSYSLEYCKVNNKFVLVHIASGHTNWIIRYEYDYNKIAYDKCVCNSLHLKVLSAINKYNIV